jgi:1-(5-phosphoribosyl)-5-[(5-phosphoribosylamino)methylideneamino] imidazole-4-carboxamide isomerase/N-(5'phosphoribosyl)anthranilate isomerase
VTSLVLLPAVDVADGQAVRLVQGAAGSETSYGDPVEAALAWQQAGAEWLHLVDLDAAFGRGSNAALLAEVAGKVDMRVEMSGGIRDDESLERALATGCERVNIGTAALEKPAWVREIIARHGDKIAVGLDVRGTTLAARGWTSEGGELFETLARLDAEGCARYVVTDVLKDGTLRGPNLDLLRSVCAATDRPVVASGGVSSLDDLRALAGLAADGVEGAIVGKALYAGAFTLREALAAVASLWPRKARQMPPSRCGSSLAWTWTAGGSSRALTSSTCVMPGTRSSWLPGMTRREPTSSPSSTSRPQAAAGRRCTTWCGAPPSRSSSR